MTTAQARHLAADRSPRHVVDDGDPSGPRVRDDMTVEVALSLMAGARVDHLVLCDGDDQRTGLITLARLAVLRGSPAYTDRIRLRDILHGPFTAAGARPGPLGELGRTPASSLPNSSRVSP
ncbi:MULTISPECIES: CBS domain-containing protein [unclassified Streptomyces]|uniref:CBS domain-containing protein n=1 Tax=unclassified Streptomyces TaxID=2593676 RepID=UPI002E7A7943|nr:MULTISPECIES: CBS domain-containing protein [unclassified Streptomyces]MEE1764700.1 CBS domain-containing protein [Streptomyces sp. SP18BB07]MEE1835524.1 CBS domain-containing protein [Streptomyces sp. SP17KL33]